MKWGRKSSIAFLNESTVYVALIHQMEIVRWCEPWILLLPKVHFNFCIFDENMRYETKILFHSQLPYNTLVVNLDMSHNKWVITWSSPLTVNLMLTFVPDLEIQQPIISPGLKAVPYFSFFAFSTLLPVEQRPKEFKCSPRPKDILFFIADCKGLKTEKYKFNIKIV